MRKLKFGLAGILMLMVAQPALSELTVKQYEWVLEEQKTNPELKFGLNRYIAGIGEGFNWANARLTFLGQPTLYCQPDNLVLKAPNYLDMLTTHLEREEERISGIGKNKVMIGALLLDELISTFPCK